ncbi:protein enabled homolog [Eriocheir sinensis]|uniref:protein enabled homolog n=1 Tax=Eriocheir sinensis TaxID=95602 RepID=UPI0021CABF71|nr:protein enabled homolog [Eriocheir sinensis]
MDKASKAIRRSGVKLRSLSSGHGDLQMVISQLGEVRASFKAFALAQATAADDLLRWAGGGSSGGGGGGGGGQENRAIEETFAHLAELSVLWSEVQKDFADQLKEYRTQYELILEGEKHVTDAREVLSLREQREGKLRRDLKRASKKAPVDEVCMLKEKLGQAERSRDLAHLDVVERTGENEAVKMIRVKEGLLRLSAAYCDLAHKCLVIFTAHRDIAAQLPDVHDRDLQGIKYTGAGSAMRCVQDAKERVRAIPSTTDPTTPYSPPTHPPPHRYPPTAPSHPHPPITHSPSLPEEHAPPSHPPQGSPHSNSAPNLVEDVPPATPTPHAPHTLPPVTPLSANERSGFTDTTFRPDTSASSPDLAYPPQPLPPHEPQALPSPPYNPCYEWLPGRGATDGTDGINETNAWTNDDTSSISAATHPHQAIDTPSGPPIDHGMRGWPGTGATTPGVYPTLNGLHDNTTSPTPPTHPLPASVRPRVGRNPFWDSEEEEEEREEAGGGGGGGVASLSGALKKTAISLKPCWSVPASPCPAIPCLADCWSVPRLASHSQPATPTATPRVSVVKPNCQVRLGVGSRGSIPPLCSATQSQHLSLPLICKVKVTYERKK